MMAKDDTAEFIPAFIEQWKGKARVAEVRVRPIRGGLESTVEEVSARLLEPDGRPRVLRFVIKRVQGPACREAAVYQEFVSAHAGGLSPRLLAVQRPTEGRAVLFLELVRRARAWPWRELQSTQRVLHQLAGLHTMAASSPAAKVLRAWDYEAELESSAASTLCLLEQLRRPAELAPIARGVRWTRRIVAALPRIRRQLVELSPLEPGAIHGDVHSGNVLVRGRGLNVQPVLIDWARARVGSPLEDVSSWLQSLGYWEHEARRRHDTLLSAYLAARGLERRLNSSIRQAYWLAGASNALAGALRYHAATAADERLTPAQRGAAMRAAADWLRVLRRADACWS